MKKVNKKVVVTTVLSLITYTLISNILEEKNASTWMYSIAWIPLIANFVYIFNSNLKMMRK